MSAPCLPPPAAAKDDGSDSGSEEDNDAEAVGFCCVFLVRCSTLLYIGNKNQAKVLDEVSSLK